MILVTITYDNSHWVRWFMSTWWNASRYKFVVSSHSQSLSWLALQRLEKWTASFPAVQSRTAANFTQLNWTEYLVLKHCVTHGTVAWLKQLSQETPAWNHSTHLTWPLCWNATILPCQYKDQLQVALDILTYSEHLQPLLPELLTHLDMRRYRQSNNRSCMSRMSCQKNKLHQLDGQSALQNNLHLKTLQVLHTANK